jgi:thiol-disulfide isomerase/thioredoxin
MKESCKMFAARTEPLTALFLVVAVFTTTARAELPPLTHGLTPIDSVDAAPSLRLPNLDDEIVDLEGLRGKVVVVNFWATWCPPCRREMPSLERLNQAVGGGRVAILTVNVGEDLDTVFSFLGLLEPSPTFPMLLDRDAKTLDSWSVKGLPTTFVVGRDGRLRYRAVGGREFDHPDLVEQLLQLAAPPKD